MNFNHRLVDSSSNPLARELLRSADLDEPPDYSVTRLALVLGLGSSALVTTAATSATASMGVVASSSAATATTTTASAGASALVSVGGIASSAALSSVGSATIATGAAPALGGAVSALGMLKAMAVVSLTCGALSFGGTKLAMTLADKPVAVSVSAAPMPVSAHVAKATASRAASVAALDGVAAPPAPPSPKTDDDVAAAPGQEGQPSDVSNDPAQPIANERNVGRQDISVNSGVNADSPALLTHDALVPEAVANAPSSDGRRVSAVAAFPSDDEQPPPAAANTQVDKGALRQAKTAKAQADSDLEREVALLDRARGALAAGQPLVALQALDAYRKEPRRGTLRAESVVLRVKALLALGQRSAAEREARPLINAAPQSRHAVRLRELLGVPANAP
jgi:hypothetical protein